MTHSPSTDAAPGSHLNPPSPFAGLFPSFAIISSCPYNHFSYLAPRMIFLMCLAALPWLHYPGCKNNFLFFLSFFLKDFKFIFRERGREGEKRREGTLMCGYLLCTPYRGPGPQPQARALTGNRTGDPLVCRPVLKPLSHSSQGKTSQ